MSIDGSVMSSVSQIRQFGLYRTIDARTEEFLRASRKRQMRQGCACAAISTAITVTVVVTVILVYEYSINAELNFNKNFILKPNWIGVINNSTDVTIIDSKFTKKMNLDKSTMKLLPILIKALNKNRYLERILEDYSSASPTYDKKATTEFSLVKNIFSKRNWIKMPTSRLYTLEFKSSPTLAKISPKIMNIFRKNSKLQDYRRTLGYFDKMVKERNLHQQMVKRDFEPTQSPLLERKRTKPMKRDKLKTRKHKTSTTNTITDKDNMINNCKCPKTLRIILTRILDSLKVLIPDMLTYKVHACENKSSTVTSISKENNSSKFLNPLITKQIENDAAKTTHVNAVLTEYKENGIFNPNSLKSNNDQIYNVLNSKHFTTSNSLFKTNRMNLVDDQTTITDNFLHKCIMPTENYPQVIKEKITKDGKKLPVSLNYNYDDYVITSSTDKDLNKNKNIYQQIGTKIEQPSQKESNFLLNWSKFKKLETISRTHDSNFELNQKGKSINNMKKIKHLAELSSEKNYEVFSILQTQPQTSTIISTIFNLQTNTRLNIINNTDITTNNLILDLPFSQTEMKNIQEVNIADTDIDVDTFLPDDEFQEELSMKRVENTIEIPSNYLEANFKKNLTKSMLPPIRPVYLEIQSSNNWKHEDYHDYGSTYNNNAFDLTNS